MKITPVTAAPLEAAQARAKPALTPRVRASDPLNLSGTAVAARALASSPPVDLGKVERIRAAIAANAYPVDPQAIAAKMIDLDLP